MGASLVVALIFKKNKDWRVLLLFFLLAFGVIYILTSRITKMIYESGPAPLPTGGGCDGFDPKPYTDAVHEDIYSSFWVSRKHQPYKDLLSLADCQLIKVWNDWNNRYFSEDKQNLKQALDDEIANDVTFPVLRSQIFERFKRLNIA
ncbi:MAG TPA: hypothetical protein VL098_12680 [Flavipsychrobacter sp.]|nr:hypothetical protein [Flavipsychrobacter sp.]